MFFVRFFDLIHLYSCLGFCIVFSYIKLTRIQLGCLGWTRKTCKTFSYNYLANVIICLRL